MTNKEMAPAGWYPDPHGAPGLRYWNGTEWTTHVSGGPLTDTASFTAPTEPMKVPADAKTWTGASTMLVIQASVLTLFLPFVGGVWGLLLATLIVFLTVIVLTKDKKNPSKKYWTNTRVGLAVVLFNVAVWVPWIIGLPALVAGLAYFIASGIMHNNEKE